MLVKTSCFSPLHIFIARINSNDYKVQPVLDDEEFYDLLDENSFDKITRRLRIDPAMGFCRLGYAYASRYPYSYQDFYAVSPDKNCDLFRCVENGKLYLPCENDLQEYI